jgi:hypothetical protein
MLDNTTDSPISLFAGRDSSKSGAQSEDKCEDTSGGGVTDDTHGSGGSGKGRGGHGLFEEFIDQIDIPRPSPSDTHGGGGSGKG